MAVVWNAVAEKDGIEDSGDCMSIGERMESLDKIAKKLGVKPLGDFVSVDASEWLSEEEEEELVPEGEGKAQWFAAKDGLKTVRALIGHLKEKPKVFKSSEKGARGSLGLRDGVGPVREEEDPMAHRRPGLVKMQV